MSIINLFKKKKDITSVENADAMDVPIQKAANKTSDSKTALEKQEPFEICPQYIYERYYYENQAYMYDNGLAVNFSISIIKALFGFDERLLNNCLLFSELENPRKASGFEHLWRTVFQLCKEKQLIQNGNDKITYAEVFNHQNGKSLLDKAEQLIIRKTVRNDTAEIVFKSCMSTQGFADFEGYADFDFITALSILLIKDKYPSVHTVRANVYLNHGIPLENIDFPVKVEPTVDQRFIYGLINSR